MRSSCVAESVISTTASDRRFEMIWGVGGAILYLVLVFTLGLMTLRNGHGWMFFLGIFFPILWIFGAIMRPRPAT
jgi:hypothetical protein